MSEQNTLPKLTSEAQFDPAVFLETVAKGRIIATHKKKQIIFAQGDVADSVFYIKAGKIKVTVVSKQGKEAVVAILGEDEFLVRDACSDSRSVWRRLLP
jgi:CRP/FNR family transcriptional regulator, cyclic AMP receptor protein